MASDAEDSPPINFRHQAMYAALEEARAAVDMPLTPSERFDGWTEEVLGRVQNWLDDCRTQLDQSPHPTSRMFVVWVRAWDEVPGGVFDPGSEDRRKEAILKADNAVSQVIDFEELWTRVINLERLLSPPDPGDDDLGVSTGEAPGLRDRLGSLRHLLEADRPVTEEEVETWKVSLTDCGAKWSNAYGQPWTPEEGGFRFWRDQPGRVWAALAPIVRSASGVDWKPTE